MYYFSNFQIVVDDYAQSFRDLLPFEHCSPKDPKVLKDFAEALFKVRERHTNTVIIMAEAVMEMKVKATREGQIHNGSKQPRYMENIQYFLDRLYTSRISTRMLINQHTALFTDMDQVRLFCPFCLSFLLSELLLTLELFEFSLSYRSPPRRPWTEAVR